MKSKRRTKTISGMTARYTQPTEVCGPTGAYSGLLLGRLEKVKLLQCRFQVQSKFSIPCAVGQNIALFASPSVPRYD